MSIERRGLLEIIDQLLAGSLSREDASRWALERVFEEVTDPLIDEALDALSVCDELSFNGDPPYPYLVDLDELAQIRASLAE